MGVLVVMQTARDVPAGDEWLTDWERGVAASLHIAKRRADWRLGRWTAKRAVRISLDVDAAAAVEIRPDAGGAPVAHVSGDEAPCAVSISHSDGRSICAVAARGARIGCDLEQIEPRDPAFVDDYFTPTERAFVARQPVELRDVAATLVWSAKECALKAIGEGLRLDTREVEVATDALALGAVDESWQPLAVVRVADGARFAGWWRVDQGSIVCVTSLPAPGDAPRFVRA